MIVVIATMQAQTGKEKQLGGLLRSLLEPTRAEAGCLQYDLHVAENDPSSFAFYERWEDRKDLDRHLKSPHMASALPTMTELTVSPPRLEIYLLTE